MENATNKNTYVITLFSLSLFSLATISLTNHTLLYPLNHTIFNFIQTLNHSPKLNLLMQIITNFGAKYVAIFLVFGVCLYFFINKFYKNLILWVSLNTSVYLSKSILKHFIQNPRPFGDASTFNGYSFPSGHSSLTFAIYFYLAYLISSKGNKTISYIAAFTLGILVLFSRVFLNAHWLLDVIAGASLGLFWFAIFSTLHKKFVTNEIINPVKILSFAFTFFLLGQLIFFYLN